MAYDKHRRVTLQSAATATGNGTYLDVAGFGGAQLQLTGTFTATVTFEATIDLQNWVTQEVVDTNGVRQTTGTAAGIFKANTAGLAAIRARISAYTSGSVTCEGICIPDAVTYDAPGTGGSSDQIQGAAADGAAVTGNPVLCGGQDGTNAQSLLTDTSGRQIVIGAAADGAAVAGNPVLMAGQDGTNAQSLLTDTSGRPVVVGAAADGAAVAGNPVLIAGQDGTNAQSLLTDSSGSLIPGTGATNLGKAIDTAGGATDTGVASLAIRDDALAALTPVEGDYVALRVDANGALWTHDDALDAALSGSELQVDIVGALPAGTAAIGKLAANSGVDIGDVDVTSLIPGTGATSLGKAIDTAVGATDTGVAILAQRDDALAALTPVEGDYVPLRTDANGALWTHDDALDAALSGSELQVDVVAALPAGANLIGDVAPAARATGGGTSIYSAAVTTAAAVKASAGQVYGINIYNGSGAPAWLQIFNTAAAGVTLGTTAPVYSIGVPQAANASWTPPVPIVHGTAIAVGSTVSRAGTTTASMDVNIVYA